MADSSIKSIKKDTEKAVSAIVDSLTDEQRQDLLDNFDSLRDDLMEKLGV